MLMDYYETKPKLQTSRLILRPMTVEDVPALKEWMPNPTLYHYWGKNAGKADKEPSLLFSRPEKPTKSFHLGIACKESDKIIGELWIYLIENDRGAKAAFRIAENQKGNGYATEALRAMLAFCFEHTELQRIQADVDVRNLPSCRVLEKCGFTKEGLIRQGKMVSSWCDYYIYGLLK